MLSHTSMGGGRYKVGAAAHAELMAAWGAELEAGRELPALVEQHRHIGPVVVDIDLKGGGAPVGPPSGGPAEEARVCLRVPAPMARLYTDADVAALVAALRLELGRLVDLGADGVDARCFVLEKPAPRPCRGGATFKDGLHLELPMVVTRPELQFALRTRMLPHVERILFEGAPPPSDPPPSECPTEGRPRPRPINSADDAYDEAVIERNGWLVYGAKKPDEPAPWTVTRVFGQVGEALWTAAPGSAARRF